MGLPAETSVFNVLLYDREESRISNTLADMMLLKRCLFSFLIGISVGWSSLLIAGDQTRAITKNDCARLQHSEIIWHLSEQRWLCCIPKNEEEYETCIPISDMKPPPKTGIKTFPQETFKTIEPQNESQ